LSSSAALSSRAVLFDLDGVLVDSRAQHLAAWERLAAAHGLTVPEGYFRATFGLRNDAILVPLAPGADPRELERLAAEKEATFRSLATDAIEPLPGARELVTFLREQAIGAAVVTSTPRENLEMILQAIRLAGAFGVLVTAEDVARGKPDPEGFLLAARRLVVQPEACVVIEDAPAGLEAAKAAGMRAVGVTTTHPAPDLGAADLVVESLAEEAVRMFVSG
jgi:beta-phosphoglucomutase family hydrolase